MKKSDFKKGLLHGIPICLGYLAVSFGFGITAKLAGLSVLETILISMTNVTSAGQLAGVPIIASGGSLVTLGLGQLVINLRYALMSVSLSQKMDKTVRLLDRFLIAFVNTDEVFAVSAVQPDGVSRVYMYGLILTPYFGWAAGTALGALAGEVLPAVVTTALGVAIYGMFVAIVVPDAKKQIPTALCVLTAIQLSLVFHWIPFLKPLEKNGIALIICAVVASLLFAVIAPIGAKGEDAAKGGDEG